MFAGGTLITEPACLLSWNQHVQRGISLTESTTEPACSERRIDHIMLKEAFRSRNQLERHVAHRVGAGEADRSQYIFKIAFEENRKDGWQDIRMGKLRYTGS